MTKEERNNLIDRLATQQASDMDISELRELAHDSIVADMEKTMTDDELTELAEYADGETA